MKRKFDGWAVLAMCLCTAVLSMGLIYALIYNYVGGKEGLDFITKLNAVRDCVEEKYVGDVDWSEAADLASAAIVEATEDRWSYYMTAEEYGSYTNRLNNSMVGIGVTVTPDAEGRGVEVISLVEGSPADRAGIKAGYIITGIAGESIAGADVSAVGELIRSHSDEYSILCIDGEGETHSFTLKNEVIYMSPVSYELMDENVGYIRISNFERNAAAESMVAMKKLSEQGASSLIFDVRANPGGQLTELTQLLDYLLPEGEIFISVDADGEEEIYTSNAAFVDMPMVVLLDENSYSAAEFFAAALGEYGAATLIGSPSTGKARSQQTFILSDGSAVHISTRNYLTPERVNLAEEGGLEPHIRVEPEADRDAALERALEYLS